MFTTNSGWEDDDTQSWYGAPQHEESGGENWEHAYYGGEREELPGEVEFVPEIEYPVGFVDETATVAGRRLRPLFVS